MYTCTCMDWTVHATICKHIHLIEIHKTKQDTQDAPSSFNIQDTQDDPSSFNIQDTQDDPFSFNIQDTQDDLSLFNIQDTQNASSSFNISTLEKLLDKSNSITSDLSQLRHQMKEQLLQLITLIENCNDAEAIKVPSKHISSAISLFNTLTTSTVAK